MTKTDPAQEFRDRIAYLLAEDPVVWWQWEHIEEACDG